MLKTFQTKIKSMSKISIMMIHYGYRTALGVLIIGILSHSFYSGYINRLSSLDLVMSGFRLFILFSLGGIIFDIVEKNR